MGEGVGELLRSGWGWTGCHSLVVLGEGHPESPAGSSEKDPSLRSLPASALLLEKNGQLPSVVPLA